MRIEVADLSEPQLRALLTEHLDDMRATSPPESIHALDLSGLADPAVTVWTAWGGSTLLACAALKQLSPTEGEIKSMRTSAHARRRGVGSAMVTHVIGQARERGYVRVSLETGTQQFFAPARRLYAAHGFVACDPFDGYTTDPSSAYFSLELA